MVWFRLLLSALFGLTQALQITFTGFPLEGGIVAPITMSVDEGADVYNALLPRCTEFQFIENCLGAMDAFSYRMHGTAYTPQLPNRTVEDAGVDRAGVLIELVERFEYQRYLEIGCDLDEVFNLMKVKVSSAIGVDPLYGGTLRMTSDEFFEQNAETFDLIFVDGDHSAEYAHRDIENALRVLEPGGTIVIHDCNPRIKERQLLSNPIYNGDVWKVVPIYRAHPEVEVVTIDADHGIAVLRRRPNQHLLAAALQQQQQAAREAPLHAFSYEDLSLHRQELLRLVTIADFRTWLDEEHSEKTRTVDIPAF